MLRALLVLCIAAGGCIGQSTVPPPDGATAPDLGAYYLECANQPSICPTPYECTLETTWHGDGPRHVCLIPCSQDSECPKGFFCMGVNESSDVGADHHCIRDV